jgi:hypothetical protein
MNMQPSCQGTPEAGKRKVCLLQEDLVCSVLLVSLVFIIWCVQFCFWTRFFPEIRIHIHDFLTSWLGAAARRIFVQKTRDSKETSDTQQSRMSFYDREYLLCSQDQHTPESQHPWLKGKPSIH